MFVLVDDYSTKSWVMLLKNKAEAEDRLEEWKALMENERGLKLGRLRTYNGGEFTGAALRIWLKEKGVNREFTPPRTPQANGVAERMNRTLQEMARSMMHATRLGEGSWGEVFLTASYLRNRGPVRDIPSTPTCLTCCSGMRRTGLTITRTVMIRRMKRRREVKVGENPRL